MATIKSPIIFCSTYSDCQDIIIPVPFGLPAQTIENPLCNGLDRTLDGLNKLMRPFVPFLHIMECALKVTNIMTAIPDMIGPPPSISKIAEVAENIADFVTNCLPYLIKLTPIGSVTDFCSMLKGISQALYAILSALKQVYSVQLNLQVDVFQLNTSTDPYLQRQGVCLQSQLDTLTNNLGSKLDIVIDVLGILNQLLGSIADQIPPLKNALVNSGVYPIVPNFEPGIVPPNVGFIDDLLIILNLVGGAANICALGT